MSQTNFLSLYLEHEVETCLVLFLAPFHVTQSLSLLALSHPVYRLKFPTKKKVYEGNIQFQKSISTHWF